MRAAEEAGKKRHNVERRNAHGGRLHSSPGMTRLQPGLLAGVRNAGVAEQAGSIAKFINGKTEQMPTRLPTNQDRENPIRDPEYGRRCKIRTHESSASGSSDDTAARAATPPAAGAQGPPRAVSNATAPPHRLHSFPFRMAREGNPPTEIRTDRRSRSECGESKQQSERYSAAENSAPAAAPCATHRDEDGNQGPRGRPETGPVAGPGQTRCMASRMSFISFPPGRFC